MTEALRTDWAEHVLTNGSRMSRMLQALGNKTRLKLLMEVARGGGGLSVTGLVERLQERHNITTNRNMASQDLSAMRQLGLLEMQKIGKSSYYILTREAAAWLQPQTLTPETTPEQAFELFMQGLGDFAAAPLGEGRILR